MHIDAFSSTEAGSEIRNDQIITSYPPMRVLVSVWFKNLARESLAPPPLPFPYFTYLPSSSSPSPFFVTTPAVFSFSHEELRAYEHSKMKS